MEKQPKLEPKESLRDESLPGTGAGNRKGRRWFAGHWIDQLPEADISALQITDKTLKRNIIRIDQKLVDLGKLPPFQVLRTSSGGYIVRDERGATATLNCKLKVCEKGNVIYY